MSPSSRRTRLGRPGTGTRRRRSIDRWRRREARFLKQVLAYFVEDFNADRVKTSGDLQKALTSAMHRAIQPGDVAIPAGAARMGQSAATAAADVAVELTLEQLRQRGPELLEEERSNRAGFERRLSERWGAGLALAEMVRATALEAGMAFHDRNMPAEGDWTYAALVQLHARGCLIASEILALLRTGHAAGAHARWRSLHEVAIVAIFIAQSGDEVARRYLLHLDVDRYRALADYQRYAPELGYERFSELEVRAIKAARDELVAKFGDSYASEYGWAANVLSRTRPSFRDIEEAVDLNRWRPWYRLASQATHAGSHPLHYNLGLLGGRQVMLSGPSNAGLADPGHAMCISLTQLTLALLAHNATLDDVVAMRILLRLSDAAGSALLEAHHKLVAEEADGEAADGRDRGAS